MTVALSFCLVVLGAVAGAVTTYVRERHMWRQRRWEDRKPDLFADYLHSMNQTVRLFSEASLARVQGREEEFTEKFGAAQDERHAGRRLLVQIQLLEPVLDDAASDCYSSIRPLRELAWEGMPVDDDRWKKAHEETDRARLAFVLAASRRLHSAPPSRDDVQQAWQRLERGGYRQAGDATTGAPPAG